MMYTPGYAGEDFLNMDPYFISDKKKKEGICLSVKDSQWCCGSSVSRRDKETGGIHGRGFLCGI
mgnify:CR=1 FL=1